MQPQDDIQISDQFKATINQTGQAQMVRVIVVAESGINKNGQHHPKGSEVVISAQSAAAFVATDDVQYAGGTSDDI